MKEMHYFTRLLNIFGWVGIPLQVSTTCAANPIRG